MIKKNFPFPLRKGKKKGGGDKQRAKTLQNRRLHMQKTRRIEGGPF